MLPVYDEQLAAHLGLEELRVGASQIDSDRNIKVLAWWTVSVEPSFDPSWVIGAVYDEEWKGGPDADRVSAKGFIADREIAAISPLSTDEVLDALERLNPFRPSPTPRQKCMVVGPGHAEETWLETRTLDGIGYTVRWETQATEGFFRFSNPRVDWLKEFEIQLFHFAQRVAAASGEVRIEDRLRLWAEHQNVLPQTSTDGPSPIFRS